MLRRILLCSVLGAIALAARPAAALDKVTLGTDWRAEAEHGGYYQAIATGIYAKYGIEVTLRQGGPQVNHSQLLAAGRLDFDTPDTDAFPCLQLAYRALDAERSLPVVLNAANEVAVARFLDGRIAFTAIPHVIEATMRAHVPAEVSSIAAVRNVDHWARAHAQDVAATVELKL